LKLYTLKKEQIVLKDISTVFDFFSKPENLSVITPHAMKFKILTPSPIDMKVGTLIDYTINIIFMPIRWRTLITKYDPPNIFVDQQLSGPYSMWHHTHTFEQLGDNETLIKDEVIYSIPFAFIGRITHYLYIKGELEKIFTYRKNKIEEIIDAK
jgi:hypothetical protein